MSDSYINLRPKKRQSKIYRVFSFERLIQLFKTDQNILVRPQKWDDPFENLVLYAAYKSLLDEGENSWAQSVLSVKDSLYGQCWSFREESDAMWRIYSPEKNGVNVRTTVDKLFGSLRSSTEGTNKPCFIGAVRYLQGSSLRRRLKDPSWLSAEAGSIVNKVASLFLKRREFEHEEEVRLVVLDGNVPPAEGLFRYTVEPKELIDEIVFDPRMSEELYNVYENFLKREMGYQGAVRQSSMYKVPDLWKPKPHNPGLNRTTPLRGAAG